MMISWKPLALVALCSGKCSIYKRGFRSWRRQVGAFVHYACSLIQLPQEKAEMKIALKDYRDKSSKENNTLSVTLVSDDSKAWCMQ